MSSEPVPLNTAPAAPRAATDPDDRQLQAEDTEGAATAAEPSADDDDDSVVVSESGMPDTAAAEDDPDGGPEAPVDPPLTPDPRLNGSRPTELAPGGEPATLGAAASTAPSSAASAASVAVASAVSVTADKLSSAGAAARTFGQVVAASIATPPAGFPLLRKERRTEPTTPPPPPPIAINLSATATVPGTRPATPPAAPPAEGPLTEPNEARTGTVEAPPEAPADSAPSAETITEPQAPTPEPVAPPVSRHADAAVTTATLPPVPTIGPAPITPVRRRPRRARLKVTRLDPWTVMKVAFLLSLAAGIMTVVAVAVLWSVLNSADVFSEVGATLRDVTGGDEGDGFNLESYLSLRRVLTFTGIIAGIEVIVLTALTTLGAFLYNVSSRMAGGVEVTLAEDD